MPHAPPADDDARSPVRRFGLFAAADFDVRRAPSSWPGVPPAALAYFRDETVALPMPGTPVADYGRGVDAFADLRAWSDRLGDAVPRDAPPLVWVAAPDALHGARIDAGGERVRADARTLAFGLAPRDPLNRSWLDASSFAFLARGALTIRGTREAGAFVARTVWPEAFALASSAPALRPATTWTDADVRALVRREPAGGARSPFAVETIWQRDGGAAPWDGKAVLAIVLNGAQGDDDEAHGGHFALATGVVARGGGMAEWLVHNFYTLDSASEKGILAAPVPFDGYLADLNAGQSWYRPSVVLVAVLDDARAAWLVQSALARTYAQFYRHQIVYHHPRVNCTSISVDVLDALGLPVARRGASAPGLGRLALPWLVARERGLAAGVRAADYLIAETTRLLPAVAFESIAVALLGLVQQGRPARGRLARWLAQDVSALALARIPQFPSSRAWGDAPVASLAEYRARLPRHRRDYRIVPVPDRPFPAHLRDPDLIDPARTPGERALAAWAIAVALAIAAAVAWLALGG